MLSIPGVYGGLLDKIPFGAAMNKGLTFRMGQTHVQRYGKKLLEMIGEGKLDTTFMISHREPLSRAAELYAKWHDEQDSYTKIILKPGMDQKPRVNLVAARQVELVRAFLQHPHGAHRRRRRTPAPSAGRSRWRPCSASGGRPTASRSR